jgi:hypothetical protein
MLWDVEKILRAKNRQLSALESSEADDRESLTRLTLLRRECESAPKFDPDRRAIVTPAGGVKVQFLQPVR